nr:immunoglobulin heavy chain junction region [Macaca mulatta]
CASTHGRLFFSLFSGFHLW